MGDENVLSFLVGVHGPEASPSIARILIRTGPIQNQQLVPNMDLRWGICTRFFSVDMVRCLFGSEREGGCGGGGRHPGGWKSRGVRVGYDRGAK